MDMTKHLTEENIRLLKVLDKDFKYLRENEKRLLLWYYPYYQNTLSILIIIKLMIENNYLNEQQLPILEYFSKILNECMGQSIKIMNNLYPSDGQLWYGIGLLSPGMSTGTLISSIDYIISAIKNKKEINEEEITEWGEAQKLITQDWYTFLLLYLQEIKENIKNKKTNE